MYAEDRNSKLMEDVVAGMRDDVSVQLVKGDAFQVSYLSNDARTAMRVTERLASLFIEENLRDREGLAEGANQFLESQLDDARRKLVEHETKLSEYKRQYNGELPSQTYQSAGDWQQSESPFVGTINRDRDRRLMLDGSRTLPIPATARQRATSRRLPTETNPRLRRRAARSRAGPEDWSSCG